MKRARAFFNRHSILTITLALIACGILITATQTASLNLADKTAVWSGFGTLMAVIVALVIAVESSIRLEKLDRKRAASAAILIGRNLFELRATLDVVRDNEALVKTNRRGYSNWLSKVCRTIYSLPNVVEDQHLPFAVDLPSDDLYLIAVVDDWLRSVKARELQAFSGPISLDNVAANFDAIYKRLLQGQSLVELASDRLWHITELKQNAPWIGDVPSWVVPKAN